MGASTVSLAKAKKLGTELLTSKGNHEKTVDALLRIAESEQETATTLESCNCLQAFFLPLLKSGELLARSAADGSEHSALNADDRTADGSGGHGWLRVKYRAYTRSLLQLLAKDKVPTSVKKWVLELLMDLVRTERQTQFSNDLFLEICSRLVHCRWLTDDVLRFLKERYEEYKDIRFYFHTNIRKLIDRRASQLRSGRNENELSSDDDVDPSQPVSIHTFARNVFGLLSNVLPPVTPPAKKTGLKPKAGTAKEEPEEGPVPAWCDGAKEGKWRSAKWQKQASSSCWLAFLQLPLPADLYKKVLVSLHSLIIPSLTSPLLLSDFLTDSYDIGGVVSVMALNGLFVLITEYSFEYPDFYRKLYALLEPSVFAAKHRSRFFELVDICLQSPHLPAYLAAAFAKRASRLALHAPPAGALLVIALVHNLLRRHPSISTLVHQPSPTVNKGVVDPFLEQEEDPANSRALESSLWEMDSLRQHYCPAVARFVSTLETDLSVRAKTAEVDIRDFTQGSYTSIINEEASRRIKSAPLAFYRTLPSALFQTSGSGGGGLQAEQADEFSGWSFSYPPPSPEPASEPGTGHGKGSGSSGGGDREEGAREGDRLSIKLKKESDGNEPLKGGKDGTKGMVNGHKRKMVEKKQAIDAVKGEKRRRP